MSKYADPTETHYGDDWEESVEAMDFRDEQAAREDDVRSERRCIFPGQCCMAGDHLPSECHTPEMIEEQFG